ncbi:MAG: hypothetical protein GY699_21775 [Desulfobacteraceae bacterium]|nr:hypothetical protein [Desulfobacteraceae bacterium]
MATIKMIKPGLLIIMIVLGAFLLAQARTSLVSLPSRQHVDIRINLNNLDQTTTLVQEKRTLTLKKGINKIDFSWQNVMIDPSSITLTTLSNPDKITLLSVSYPPNEAALIWDIHSQTDLEEQVILSYLLSNIDGMVTYKAIADTKETRIDLKTFLVLRNFSGENFNNVATHTNSSKPFNTRIHNLETKRILVSQKQNIPIKKIYTWNASEMPHEPEKSNTAVGIPTSYEINVPLFKGKTRVFQQDNKNSTIFLGEDMANFTPKGDKANLHIGDSRDIIVTQHRLDTKRTNIQRNTKGHIQVYDEIIKDKITMENLKDRPVILSLIETIPGQWNPVHISMDYELENHKTLKFSIKLLPKEKKTLNMHFKVLNIFSQKFAQFNRVMN